MAPHLSLLELARIREWVAKGNTPLQAWNLHIEDRGRQRLTHLCLTAFRKAVKGQTHRGGPER
eukprot:957390-Karenia_brevis.AAC.1